MIYKPPGENDPVSVITKSYDVYGRRRVVRFEVVEYSTAKKHAEKGSLLTDENAVKWLMGK